MFTGKSLKVDQKYTLHNIVKKPHKYYFSKHYYKQNIYLYYKYSINIFCYKNIKLNIKQLQHIYKKLKFNVKQNKIIPNKFKFENYIHFSHICTKKPKDIRMGRGKGLIYSKIATLHLGFCFLSIFYFSKFFCF
jgi:hypothetical protein